MALERVDVDVLMPTPPPLPEGGVQLKLPLSLLGLRGLNNLGQTCFMNCILQILVHCPPVARFFLSDRHNRHVCQMRRRQAQSDSGGDGPLKPCLGCEMDAIFAACFSGTQAPLSPHTFIHAMWCSSEHFAGYEQHDAHEFLVALLAGIYSAMRQPSCLPPPPPVPAPLHPGPASLTRPPSLGESRGGQPAGKACEEMSSIFAGVLRSEVRCEVCGHRSTKLEDFFDISLELGRGSSPTAPGASGPAAGGGGAAGTSGGDAESLEACLRAFTTEEQLLSEERCWCSSCAALQDASKQMSIERLPNVLCLQLKRFRQESRGKQTSKMDSFVQFPLASLNMYRYTSAFLTARDGKGRKTPTPPPPACGGGGGVARERGARRSPHISHLSHISHVSGGRGAPLHRSRRGLQILALRLALEISPHLPISPTGTREWPCDRLPAAAEHAQGLS